MNERVLMTGVGGIFAVLLLGCQPDYPNCKKDAHCKDGEFCVNNICQQCRDRGDCPAGQECADGACREIPGYCTGNEDCADGQICRDNMCGPCLQSSDCAENEVCADGICMIPECETDEECPAGLRCVNYRCQVDSDATSQLGDGDCTLEPVYFEFDSWELQGENRQTLEDNFVCLQKRGGRITLEGHTCEMGTTEYNMALGERRSRAVADLLRRMGIDRENMRVTSKGEEEAMGRDETSRARDRKVEFK